MHTFWLIPFLTPMWTGSSPAADKSPPALVTGRAAMIAVDAIWLGKRYATTNNVEIFGEGWFRRLVECPAAARDIV